MYSENGKRRARWRLWLWFAILYVTGLLAYAAVTWLPRLIMGR